jgi:hypothetical protein
LFLCFHLSSYICFSLLIIHYYYSAIRIIKLIKIKKYI